MRLIDRLKKVRRRLPKLLSRNQWLVRLLDLPACSGTGTKPGLVLIQIDGLSRSQFRRALAHRRLPFIRKLLHKRGYTEKPFYSGLPSSTPAVQGELFYGVKTAVPAFEFVDRKTGERHAMFYPSSANKVARKLKIKGQPLLEDGSAYSHVYSGGAATARYCAESMHLPALLTNVNPWKSVLILAIHTTKLFRIIGYAGLELVLAVWDFFKGVLSGENLIKELKFIATRLFLCVILRELIRMRMKMDIARGIPIVTANLLGYDEQAHRRGPGSAFAHWTLKGIDEVVKDIYRTALRSDCRDYRLVIYSDHGQEAVESYAERFGKPLKQAVRETLWESDCAGNPERLEQDNTLEHIYRRAANLFFGNSPVSANNRKDPAGILPDDIKITTMGPLGHIYFLNADGDAAEKTIIRNPVADGRSPDLEKMARMLTRQAGIPLVLFKKNGQIMAANDCGTFDLEEKKGPILGKDHPFLDQAAEDLKALCRHPDAGDLVISGYRPGKTPYSFSIENGAHGGPGKEETQGVVLLPPCMRADSEFLRPLDLRGRIFRYLGKTGPGYPDPATRLPARGDHGSSKGLKIITYNIHSCIHMDGRINPDRTAGVIAAMGPDIAMLQEVDAHRRRTDFTHQGEYLAKRLGMACRFFPILENCGEQYGLAILSRFPFVSLECIHFPPEHGRWSRESRGAILGEVDTPLGPVRIVNTHLGLRRGERFRQATEILSNRWVRQALEADLPLIICGDLNDGPRSAVYKKIVTHVSDIQSITAQKGYPRATFFSRWPVLRLDHIFVSRHFRPGRVMVPNDYETRLVSDHLPLYCELEPAAL